jgi:DNA gyrase subunit A
MIINRSGLTIRTSADQIRVAGRATQGVKVIDLREGDAIASVTAVPKTEEDELDDTQIVTDGGTENSGSAESVPATENSNE